MNKFQPVVRLENDDRQNYLYAMHQSLKAYFKKIQEIIQCYHRHGLGENFHWEVPRGTYVNFRDALCHYATACHHEELIAILQESNAMNEHLHRAIKDLAVNYLQVLGQRLDTVYTYQPTAKDFIAPACAKHGSQSADLPRRIGQLAEACSAECIPLVRYYYTTHLSDRRSLLQHWLHCIRQFDLKTRNISLKIGKPFEPNTNNLNDFFELINACETSLRDNGLYAIVYLYGRFFDNAAVYQFQKEVLDI